MTLHWPGLFLLAGGVWAQPSFDGPVEMLVVEGRPPVMYAGWRSGIASSALFRSADEGASWLPVYMTDPALPQPLIRSLVVDPTNPAILFVASDPAHGGIWRSGDRGATWSASNSGLPADDGDVQSLWLFRPNPAQMYARTAQSVFKSLDGGRSWSRQGALPEVISLFTINESNPDHMYCATSAGVVYHSADQGVSWQRVSAFSLRSGKSTDYLESLVSAPLNPRLVYAVVFGSATKYPAGVHYSADYGSTWTNIAPGTQPWAFYPDPAGRSIGYYTGSWQTEVCKNAGLPSGSWNCFPVGSPEVRLWIQPSAPDTIYAGTSNGVYKSTDGAVSWRFLQGTVRPTLAKPAEPLNFTLIAGTQGYRKVDLRAIEYEFWKVPFTASSTQSWISCEAAAGTTPASLPVTVNASGLATGSYEGSLQVSAPASVNSSVTVPVRLTVVPATARGPAYDLAAFAGTGKSGFSGDGGPASAALFSYVSGVALDGSGAVYIADSGNERVRKAGPDGVIRTIAGTGQIGLGGDNGPATAAQLWSPHGIAVTGGSVYISDTSNARLRVISPAGTITTVLGGGLEFLWPVGLAVDQVGDLYVADSGGEQVLKLSSQGGMSIAARGLDEPSDVAVDAAGALYIAETHKNRILKVDVNGNATTIAGTGRTGFDGDGGPAASASLSAPEGVAVDPAGQIYIADTGNHRIRVISPQGTIRTVAGTGTAGSAGTGGPAAGAQLDWPSDLVVDASGSIYVADTRNHRAVKLTLQAGSGPRISAGGVVHAASYTAETAPGALFSIFGAELASGSVQAEGMPWPLSLAGASVTVNGRPAPMYYAGPNQINAQLPYETSLGKAEVVVSSGDSYSIPASLTVSAAAPGVFQATQGRALAQHPDGSLNGVENGAAAGSVIVVYLTGQGLLDNPIATGAAAPMGTLSRPVLPVSATIGGQPAEVLFLGMTPGLIGLAQANIRIPSLPEGDYPLVITIGTKSSKAALVAIAP